MNLLRNLLSYDETNHEYFIADGKKITIPSVTQLMRLTGVIGEDDYKPSPIYMVRGTDVHAMTELADDGRYMPEMLLEEYRPFMAAYQQFLDEHDIEYVDREQTVFSDDLFYAGRFDRLWEVDGMLTLTDIKTGYPARWHRIQLAAYQTALDEVGIEVQALADLYLSKEGTYQFKVLSIPERNDGLRLVEAMSNVYWFNHTQNHKRLTKLKEEG